MNTNIPLSSPTRQADVDSRPDATRGNSVTPTISVPPGRLLSFFSLVKKGDECWLWIGARTETGYSAFQNESGEIERAHRLAFRWWKGDVPEGFDVHHICGEKLCVNPEHLEALSKGDHRQRHCRRGHLLTTSNSVFSTFNGHTSRKCAICHRERARNRQRALRRNAAATEVVAAC